MLFSGVMEDMQDATCTVVIICFGVEHRHTVYPEIMNKHLSVNNPCSMHT